MARSTYIYIVMDPSGPRAAFTVKHEMISWLEKHGIEGSWVVRAKDAPSNDVRPEHLQYGA